MYLCVCGWGMRGREGDRVERKGKWGRGGEWLQTRNKIGQEAVRVMKEM